ncbi:MAG: 50S ribosomal protein L17 [Candidatus Schekmanbacteria bacterium RBG_16_38_11]|uniref:Large ribosomal subunit protein bL17 n=2 Tax=Candidatus Schekmaniibacteriota TaxID=1817811 RepID=A0A1F7RGB4_9BACT|nr:MAG: 50S ribosomal protein L17 [Candidatus Schekmanbacteria bacterium GWA2_38_11]OGL44188.1 MAG: 50S ribosomal protein L17 [Candidatus Schekmanbacteria bacterium RBG_16_38_11]
MKHNVMGRKLGRTTSHRIAMLRNMVTSLFEHGRIETTTEKAKELRRVADRMVTLAKQETLHSRRLAARWIKNKDVLKKLFSEIGSKYSERKGGYTRIIRTRIRHGDGAEMAIIELVE